MVMRTSTLGKAFVKNGLSGLILWSLPCLLGRVGYTGRNPDHTTTSSLAGCKTQKDESCNVEAVTFFFFAFTMVAFALVCFSFSVSPSFSLYLGFLCPQGRQLPSSHPSQTFDCFIKFPQKVQTRQMASSSFQSVPHYVVIGIDFGTT